MLDNYHELFLLDDDADSCIEYTVKVDTNGYKYWFIEGVEYTEEEFNQKTNNCDGKTVVIESKEYTLKLK